MDLSDQRTQGDFPAGNPGCTSASRSRFIADGVRGIDGNPYPSRPGTIWEPFLNIILHDRVPPQLSMDTPPAAGAFPVQYCTDAIAHAD
jgi:hypothetical protein